MIANRHWSDSQADAAIERGKAKLIAEPRAIAARYDTAADRIIVDLTSGATFAFPPALVEFLQDATPEQLAEVEVQGAGFGLHWETLDVDYTVPGLMNGVFGTARWMAARAGQATSSAKVQASRENGKKGGRPRKVG
ncbi:DUF2442 domain-containing protein [Blastomonas sp.]|uniref:DUF2442 domain-containing protein n=1 Tax=Blastomonas sp. TaxID=1909299 RepID=UPI00261F7F66|nr:DUF2442 domain-containing protein [Blastomonas sp.]MDM7957611.1 DUF2442 domain-containing protein [Blastomonas sp.]